MKPPGFFAVGGGEKGRGRRGGRGGREEGEGGKKGRVERAIVEERGEEKRRKRRGRKEKKEREKKEKMKNGVNRYLSQITDPGHPSPYTNPRAFECLGCCDPLIGVWGEHLFDQTLHLPGHSVPFRRWKLEPDKWENKIK